jgi:hypothetical protein
MPANMALGVLGGITRSWNDSNKNFVPDCTLENPLANGECGQINNLNFGKPFFTNSFDSQLMGGWGVRPSDWGIVASIQQQVAPRTSVEFNYSRRWLNNFTVTDNLLQASTDFTPFSVTAPTDSRLGSASGTVLNGLYNVQQNVASTINNFNTLAANYGNQYQHFNGLLMNVQSRVKSGLTLSGGFNTGKTVSDNCEIRAQLPELTVAGIVSAAGPGVNPSNPWCHIDTGWITRATALGSYIIPKVDVLFSSTFRSDQGGQLAANWTIPLAVAQAGGFNRAAFANGASPTVNLVRPGSLYGDRVNELDFKIAKIVRFGGARLNAGLEIYNALNANAVLTYAQTFSTAVLSGPGAWLQPTQIMTPRFFKFTAQFDF